MNIEIRHLRAIVAIHYSKTLAEAADQLHVTQSALSHQIKGIREQLGIDLFVKNVKPLKLSEEGLRFLRAAERILPEIDALKAEVGDLQSGKTGRLHIAIECHACYEWLFPVLSLFRDSFSNVDIDIRPGLSFRALAALAEGEVDVVISSDPENINDIEYHHLFNYSPTFIASYENPLSEKSYIEAIDFSGETLITYPVERSRLDVFSQFLLPAKVEPKLVRQVELTAVILLLVGANKGISVLPDWVLGSSNSSENIVSRPLTADGLDRKLYAATRITESQKAYMHKFLELCKKGQFYANNDEKLSLN
ncbi:MAG: LysR substrate-binding domain-containing protein [Pseudomonadota bacterium]|nr:LysR substrate-binding domain-containing protein [Pseudomonadota bacterium]